MYFQRYTCANKYEKYVQTHYFQGNTNQGKKYYFHPPIQIFNEVIILKKQFNCTLIHYLWGKYNLLVQLLEGH